ncbi:hypothetical protein [Cupriavidus gilardii]|uniref:hypothetical protein n=1 Tax=Cupriavidus gilardii TaxID=82541 RepID=UPI0021BFF349|nr:hypothetical protein [Cupriavidus gilardii]MCT9126407.1 hypothetical protein [Cupriavidus gilardii]
MQSTGTPRAAAAWHAGRPPADARHRQPPGAANANAPLSPHRIDWIEIEGDNARDPDADGLRRAWIALGALTRHHRALATVVMATAMSLPIGLAGAVVLVRGDPQALHPGVAMIIAATGLWCGTCCLFYLDQCRRLLRDGESNE